MESVLAGRQANNSLTNYALPTINYSKRNQNQLAALKINLQFITKTDGCRHKTLKWTPWTHISYRQFLNKT